MKKPTKLLLFFLTSALFLGILYWNNIEPPTPPPDPPGGPDIDQCNVQIDSLGKSRYQEMMYSKIKRDIAGMNSAENITDEEKDGLISNLEIAKMKSLILSFDHVKNNDCMNAGGLAKWASLLQKQQKIIPNAEAQKRVSASNNLSNYLAQRGAVSSFLAGEFNANRCNALISRIQVLASSPGVRDCGACSSLQPELINELDAFQVAYNNFKDLENGTNPCDPSLLDNFERYNFYYLNFPCK
jgi:hypothetical protein